MRTRSHSTVTSSQGVELLEKKKKNGKRNLHTFPKIIFSLFGSDEKKIMLRRRRAFQRISYEFAPNSTVHLSSRTRFSLHSSQASTQTSPNSTIAEDVST